MLFLNRQASIGELKNREFWSEFYSGWYEREVDESFKQGFTSPCKNLLKCFFFKSWIDQNVRSILHYGLCEQQRGTCVSVLTLHREPQKGIDVVIVITMAIVI